MYADELARLEFVHEVRKIENLRKRIQNYQKQDQFFHNIYDSAGLVGYAIVPRGRR